MNTITITIGFVIVAYAVTVFILRLKGKENFFKKLSHMKEKFGDKTGSIIHYVSYVLIPLIFGLIIIYSGCKGVSIMAILNA
jgi:hypothetical protein